jgi:hypothetical protein
MQDVLMSMAHLEAPGPLCQYLKLVMLRPWSTTGKDVIRKAGENLKLHLVGVTGLWR